MRTFTLVIFITIFLVGYSRDGQSTTEAKDVADTVYTNGRIYTVNEDQPWAEAVATKDGKFLIVGSNADAKAATGDATKIVDLGGRMAMPGMIDVHNHATGASMGKANLYLKNRV